MVIGLAHPNIEAVSVDTRFAQEDEYPGISSVEITVDVVVDITAYPDVSWEPIGTIEMEPQSVGVLETSDLFAPMLRFTVVNGGDPDYVEIMETNAWGEVTELSTALDSVVTADRVASKPMTVELDGVDWSFSASEDGTVSACSSEGSQAVLSSAAGALIGTPTTAEGTEAEMLVGILGLDATAIRDPMGPRG